MPDAPTQVAPGVHRLGNALVNCYLLEDGNRMTLVDGGLPGFRAQLDEYLRSRGRSVGDIDAVILTHAHSDHVGMVEGVRTDAPAPVHVHAKRRRDGAGRARSTSATARCSRTWSAPRPGGSSSSAAATAPPARRTSSEVTTFTRAATSTSPAARASSPRPATPPATSPSTSPSSGVLIAGDALCTYNPLTGKRGPQVLPQGLRLRQPADARLARRARAHRRRADALRPRRAVGAEPGRGRRPRT